MPLGKPTPDGEIVQGTRHYGGRTLGEATIWKCPACGKQNEGRKPEQGCGLCGAGDPAKQQAGTVERPRGAEEVVARPVRESTVPTRQGDVEPHPTAIRVLRLIEYIFPTGTDIAEILRRSLVGRVEMGMVAITATIIDSTDMRQEDLLGMARKQPGVWLAKPEAMNARVPPAQQLVIQTRRARAGLSTFLGADLAQDEDEFARRMKVEMPDTGPAVTEGERGFAEAIGRECGYRVINTLALALGNLAEELRGNTEPEKFLSPEECLSLANALLQTIPADWQGEGIEAPAPAPVDDAERMRRAEIQARLGAKPEPIYKEPPNAD